MPKVVYEIEVEGATRAANAISEMDSNVASSASKMADRWGGAFQKISRDIDTVGGKSAQVFTKAADDVLGMAAAISGGGPMAIVGALGLAVGAVVKFKSEFDKLEASLVRTQAFSWVDKLKNFKVNAGGDSLESLNSDLNAYNKALAEAQSRLNNLRASRGTYDVGPAAQATREAEKKVQQEIKQIEYDRGSIIERRTKLMADANEQQRQDFLTAQESARQEEANRLARKASDDADRARRDAAAKAEREKEQQAKTREQSIVRDVTTAIGIIDQQAEAEKKRAEEAQQWQDDELEFWAEYNRMLRESDENQQRAAASAQMMSKEMVVNNSAAIAESIGMNVLGEALDMASGRLRQFGNINRDNAQEMLTLTPQIIDSIVAETQARLFNMGLEAGKMSIMEGAHGASMLAQAAGHFSYGNAASGSAAMSAAGMHFAAGAAYAVLAQGSVGASLAIGATRGSGGLFGTGEAQGAGPYTSYAPEGVSTQMNQGGGRGGYGGGSDGRGGTAVTIVYEAGSINARDERQTAQAVSRGVNRARRDWFLSREMRSRS